MNYLVIPAYEPDQRLINLLISLKKYPDFQIIVVNDGSTEEYNDIFDKAKSYATVLSHEKNLGKGMALKTGFKYIETLEKDGIVITADSDGQHMPDDIIKIVQECKNNKDSIITGIRCFNGKIPIKSKIGNYITKYVFFLFTGIYLKDTQCGLRGFHTCLLSFMLEIEGNRYEYEMNVLLNSANKIKTIPIKTIYIDNNSRTHFKPVKDAYMIYKSIIKFSISSIISFIVDYISYIILIGIFANFDITLKMIFANIFARIISATINYTLNKNFVFKSNKKHIQTLWKYVLLAISILIINTSIMVILEKLVLNNLYIIKLVTEIILFSFSFIIQRFLIFKNKEFLNK